jgi:hypothetical protein
MDSKEIGEWRAYERHSGPLGSAWLSEVVGGIHEQLQLLNRLTGQAHFTDKQNTDSKVPQPKHFPRPYEVFVKPADEEAAENEPISGDVAEVDALFAARERRAVQQ